MNGILCFVTIVKGKCKRKAKLKKDKERKSYDDDPVLAGLQVLEANGNDGGAGMDESQGKLINSTIERAGIGSMEDINVITSTPWAEILNFFKLHGEDGKEKLKRLFTDLDTDKSGGISLNELTSGFKRINLRLNKQQVKNFHSDCDLNNDGQITLKEFNHAVLAAEVAKAKKEATARVG